MERAEKNQRIREGMRAAQAGGRHVGRPRVIDEDLVAVVAANFHPRRMPKYKLAKELGVSERTIGRALRAAREGR